MPAKPSDLLALCNLTGARVIERRDDVVFVRLPRALWRMSLDGKCCCAVCQQTGRAAYWDTLAVATKAPQMGNDYVWTVHHPDALEYDLVHCVGCDSGGGTFSYRSAVINHPGDWAVMVENGGAPTVLRALSTEAEAIRWAEGHLEGQPYELHFFERRAGQRSPEIAALEVAS